MIARTESLMSLCPTRIDLDAELREAKRATRRAEIARNREALRVAAAPLPAVPAATREALKREALRRLGLTPEAIADLMTYSRTRQTGPDGHPIITG